jgi:dipeptidyl aminopeptidase/acylaminoacyl peptidase
MLLLAVWAALGTPDGQRGDAQDIPIRFIRAMHGQEPYHIAISPEGQTLAYAYANAKGRESEPTPIFGVHLMDLATGKEHRTPKVFGDCYDNLQCLAFSPDGKMLALGGVSTRGLGSKKTLWLFEVATGKQKFALEIEGRLFVSNTIAFAPDGKTLAIGGGSGEVLLWDVETRKVRARLPGHVLRLEATFSPDGNVLATNGRGGENICLWDAVGGKKRLTFKPKGFDYESDWKIVFSPDGESLAAQGDRSGVVILLDPRTGKVKRIVQERSKQRNYNFGIAFSFDGKMLAACSDDSIRLWEVASGKERARLRGDKRVVRFALSPDGRTLVSGGLEDTLRVWDLDRVVGKPPDKAEMPRLWSALEGEDAVLAYRAIRTLTTFPRQALSFLRKSLHAAAPPPQPPMRAIERCLAELDSDGFATREKATDELKKCGVPAAPALRGVLTSKPSLEVRRRIQAILEDIESARISQLLQQVRAVEVLEHIGTPEARALLEDIAKGIPEARLTQEGKASLTRLKKRPVPKP